jgi:hypothetical protein
MVPLRRLLAPPPFDPIYNGPFLPTIEEVDVSVSILSDGPPFAHIECT